MSKSYKLLSKAYIFESVNKKNLKIHIKKTPKYEDNREDTQKKAIAENNVTVNDTSSGCKCTKTMCFMSFWMNG